MIEKFVDELIDKRKQYLLSKIQRYPRERFIASDISECDRYMVYSILNWQERSMWDEGLQAIFDRGKSEEKNVQIDLLDLGYLLIEGQAPIEIKNKKGIVICRGKIDWKIRKNGEQYPFELKTMNINTYNSIHSIDDFKKKPLHRKYLRQMQLYLYGNNAECGIFCLTDLQGHYKFMVVYLDYGECEYILQKLEFCWEHVQYKTYPERCDKSELCKHCGFKHICLPDSNITGADVIENENLENMLNRRNELEKSAEEYDDLDEYVKEYFKSRKIPDVVIGTDWRILTQVKTGKRLNTKIIPDEVKKDYMVDSETVTVKIIKL